MGSERFAGVRRNAEVLILMLGEEARLEHVLNHISSAIIEHPLASGATADRIDDPKVYTRLVGERYASLTPTICAATTI